MIGQGCVISCGAVVTYQMSRNHAQLLIDSNFFHLLFGDKYFKENILVDVMTLFLVPWSKGRLRVAIFFQLIEPIL